MPLNEKVGRVVKISGMKTVKVEVSTLVKHPVFKKYIRKSKNFLVHDPKEICKVGDVVLIRETRPISKRKHFRIVRILEKGKEVGAYDTDEDNVEGGR